MLGMPLAHGEHPVRQVQRLGQSLAVATQQAYPKLLQYSGSARHLPLPKCRQTGVDPVQAQAPLGCAQQAEEHAVTTLCRHAEILPFVALLHFDPALALQPLQQGGQGRGVKQPATIVTDLHGTQQFEQRGLTFARNRGYQCIEHSLAMIRQRMGGEGAKGHPGSL